MMFKNLYFLIFVIYCNICVFGDSVPLDGTLGAEPPAPEDYKRESAQKSQNGTKNFHKVLSDEELSSYFGPDLRQGVPEYFVTSAKLLNGHRQRRSSWPSQKTPLTYHVTAFGEEFRLQLFHNDQLMNAGCLVEQYGHESKDLRPCYESQRSLPEDNDCYYIGHSLNHNGSIVAVSTCHGLHGVISVPNMDDDIVIKPIKSKHSARVRRNLGNDNLHLIFKRQTKNKLCAGHADIEEDGFYNTHTDLFPIPRLPVHRSRRSSSELYIEVLLVADKTMHEFHGKDLKHFMMTVTNVASAKLQDSSLSRPIHLSVVKVIILETDSPGLDVVEDARYGLKSFCQWQEKYNQASDSDPQHYDLATLFTRLDLTHGSSDQSTVGLATTGGVCLPYNRCVYVEDSGVDTGLTLAHEVGHSLGLSHDGDHNNCPDFKNIMSSGGATGPESFKWSSCSKQAMDAFLSSGKASCLTDRPTSQENLAKDLPGVLYDADDQCQLWTGTRYFQHSGDPCGQLWCQDPSNLQGAKKSAAPMMDGSMCGTRKYCINAKCVDIGPNGPRAVNGAWSSWPSDWSECSRTCGGGVRTKIRKCDNPKPRLGGQDCPGENVKSQLCNVKPCNTSELQYKENQCQATRHQPVGGQVYDWIPWDVKGVEECHLMCKSKQNNRIYRRTLDGSQFYKDGTSCYGEQKFDFYRCVQGICQGLSCDGYSDSSYKFDKCGVCGGNNGTCSKRAGTQKLGVAQQWSTVINLPKGSTGVQLRNSNRFAKMTLAVEGKPIFNENPSLSSTSDIYSKEGVTVNYRKATIGNDEVMDIPEPLTVNAEAKVFTPYDDARFQPDIEYEYYVPLAGSLSYQWKSVNGRCSKQCGGGYYDVEVTCNRVQGGSIVEDKFCNIYDKPNTIGSACNTHACPPSWRSQDWGVCSSECGGGTQVRKVECIQTSNGQVTVLDNSRCPANRKPPVSRTCNVGVCSAKWETGQWPSCSMTCGRGIQTRVVRCIRDSRPVDESNCLTEKPEPRQACVQSICDASVSGDNCKDLTSDCPDYDLDMCKQYGDWAKTNCPLTCSFCSKNGGTGNDCQDKSTDCSGYGQSICNGEYQAWAKENCANFCNFCAATTSVSSDSLCQDQSSDCSGYGQSICTGQYGAWAQTNCAHFCGLCGSKVSSSVASSSSSSSQSSSSSSSSQSSSSSSASESCTDQNKDCPTYGQTICTGDYAEWASINCAKFCGHCQSDLSTSSISTADSCTDKSTDCKTYGTSICNGDYAMWAKENCASFCGHCGASSTTSCQDESDCSSYGNNVCTDYMTWANEHCPNKCGQCKGRRKRSTSTSAAPCDHVMTEEEGTIDVIGRLSEDVCNQMIVAPLGHVIKIKATETDIDCGAGDSLRIVDMNGGMPMELCDNHDIRDWTSTSNNVAVLMLVSDISKGYRLTYSTEVADTPVKACSKQLVNPSGRLASPDYPIHYPASTLCDTVISAPVGYRVQISFQEVDLEESEGCIKDSMTLLDVGTGQTDKICGRQTPFVWISTANMAKIVFASDRSQSGRGFLASYRFVLL